MLPYVNAEAMTPHLAEIGCRVSPWAHAVVTVDGAGWRREGGRLRAPDDVSPPPPYSPELNPQEDVWQSLRQNHLANRVFETCEAIVDACRGAWNSLAAQPERITSIATRDRAPQVKV